jgi:hypothetical protein
MPGSSQRFDAQTFNRLITVNEGRRFEMQFCDTDGRKIVVSLPVDKAVELGCRICDVSEHAPYLVGGVRAARERGTGR